MKLYFNYHRQLVRVDNIKEFVPFLFDKEIANFFVSQKHLISIGELAAPQPYKHSVSQEIFELLLSKLHQRIGFNNRLSIKDYREIAIIARINQNPCIIIQLESEV